MFVDTDLRQALEDVAAQAGVNIIPDGSVGGVVSVELQEVTVDDALRMILAGTGFGVVRTENYYLVFTADEESDSFLEVADTRMVQVNYIAASMARTLLPTPLQRFVRVDERFNTLAITAPEREMRRILNDLRLIDAPRERVDLSEPTVIARTSVVKLEHSSPEVVRRLLPEAAQSYVRADEDSQLLAISAPSHLLPGLLEDIRRIDRPRKHVMLDARVVVLERADLLSFGVDWDWPSIEAGTFSSDLRHGTSREPGQARWPWEMRIGYTPGREFTNALMLSLNLLTQNEEATIIASPKVLGQDGKEAEISVTTEEWFQITAEGAVGFVRTDLQQIETGTILNITPRIGDGNQLTLDMEIEVSDVVARGEQNLPVVSRRAAKTTIHLESGGTAAVAGLVDSRMQTGRSATPGLSSVPLLGHGFRTDGLSHQARQVAVFVTATLVEESEPLYRSGRARLPSTHLVDKAQYRLELQSALNALENPSP